VRAVVDVERACAEAYDVLRLWVATYGLDAPPYSGGILDAWPAEAVDAWPIFTAESAAVRAYAEAQQRRA
jgi:hypothetical protein